MPSILWGHIPKMSFETFDIRRNLPSNFVNCSLSDSKGFLWFGTQDGLVCFDGYDFQIFRHSVKDSNTIAGNFITTIFEDNCHKIWIGTSQDGVSVYDPSTRHFTNYGYGTSKGDLPSDYIGCILQDSKGTMWIGTYKGLCKFETSSQTFYAYIPSSDSNSISGEAVMCLMEDKSHNFWVGTSNGLNLLDRKSGKFKHLWHDERNSNTPSSNFIRYLLQDHRGKIWIATDNAGIDCYHPESGKYIHFSHNADLSSIGDNQIWYLYEDSRQNIWAGTINGGLNLYNPATDNFTRFTNTGSDDSGIPSNSVTSITEDCNGNLWITTHGGGIACNSNRSQFFSHYKSGPEKNSLSNNAVKCFYEDHLKKIWIGTDGGGLNCFDPADGSFKVFTTANELSSNSIIDIYPDDETHLWLATWKGGLCLFDTKNFTSRNYLHDPNGKFSLSCNNVYGILRSKNGFLWVATHGEGINRYNPNTGKFINHYNAPDLGFQYPQWGTGLVSDSDSNVWVATYAGLFKIKNEQVVYYPHNKADTLSPSGNYIYDVFVDHRNQLYVATNNGLDLYNRKANTFSNFSEKLGIAGSISSVVEDSSENLWLTSGTRIIRITPSLKTDVFENVQDGQFNNKARLKCSNGDIYLGSTDGFIVIHPNKIQTDNQAPNVYLTGFELFNRSQLPGREKSVLKKDISETPEIKLKHNQSSFSFEFVGLNYLAPAQTQYAYMLDGFDKEWIYPGTERRATYTNIKHGKYIFRVKAANGDGIWNSQGTSVKITVLPPFWLTPWAYLFYFLILVLLLQGYRRFILMKERLRNEVNRQVELDKLKTQFFTNISHELRTPLALILGPAEQLIKRNDRQWTSEDKNQLSLIRRNAQRLLQLVNQLLDFSKIEAGKIVFEPQVADMIAFLKYVAEPFEALAAEKNIEFNTTFHKSELSVKFDSDKMEKSITNLLSNAFKFTPAGGRIALTTSEAINQLQITVTDNGMGILPNDLEHIFDRYFQSAQTSDKRTQGSGIGLAMTKEYIELHHGSISVESTVDKGSSFNVLLPIEKAILQEAPGQNQTNGESLPVTTKNGSVALNGQHPVVLIVDDNADMRSYIAQGLKEHYKTVEAPDGLQAMQIASEILPAIIISDIMMPLTDGNELCRQIKTDRRTCHIPVILLTAKSTNESIIGGFDTGADDYLVKPFNMEILKSRIKNLLSNRERLKEVYKGNITAEPEAFTSNEIDKQLIHHLYEIIEKNLQNPDLNPDFLARELLMSRSSLYLKIKAVSGESVSIFVRNYRLRKAAELIKQRKYSISEIADMVGFSQVQYFSTCFKEAFEVPPSEYK